MLKETTVKVKRTAYYETREVEVVEDMVGYHHGQRWVEKGVLTTKKEKVRVNYVTKDKKAYTAEVTLEYYLTEELNYKTNKSHALKGIRLLEKEIKESEDKINETNGDYRYSESYKEEVNKEYKEDIELCKTLLNEYKEALKKLDVDKTNKLKLIGLKLKEEVDTVLNHQERYNSRYLGMFTEYLEEDYPEFEISGSVESGKIEFVDKDGYTEKVTVVVK